MYATVADIRAEGVTEGRADDARLTALIQEATRLLDKVTGQFFEAREMDLRLDGTGSRVLHLPVPVIQLTGLWPNHSVIPIAPAYYEVYASRDLPDDRANPKVVLKNGYMFERGTRNQRLRGSFGYVEADGTTPPLIGKATIKLVIDAVALLGAPDADFRRRRHFIIEESTDGQRVRYAPESARIRGEFAALAGSKLVAEVISLYKAPLAIRVVGC